MRKKISVILTGILLLLSLTIPLQTDASISDKKISLMGIEHWDDADRTSWIDYAALAVAGVGNTSVTEFIGFDISDMMDQFYYQDMVVFQTHGYDNGAGIITYKNDTEQKLSRTIVDNVFSKNSCSQLRICYVGACSSGHGGATAENFVNTLYEKGAMCVIGYLDSVLTVCNSYMLRQFCYYIGTGYSVNNSLLRAEQDVFNKYGTYGTVNQRLVRGTSGIAMTDSSYRSMGSSTYSLENYASEMINIDSGEVVFADETSVCMQNGETYSFDENNQICSYILLDLDEDADSRMNDVIEGDSLFESFDLEGYRLEINQYETSEMHCMRAYINDIKTNDVIYYTLDENNKLLSYAYPRVGSAYEVRKNFSDVCLDDVMTYVQNNYGYTEIEDVTLDVDDINNPCVNVSYRYSTDDYESIETISIPLVDVFVSE